MSRKQAIDSKCRDCIYDPEAPGTWRQQVTLCTVFSCPLWEYRPKAAGTPPESILSYYGEDSRSYQDFLRNTAKEAA